MSYLANDSDTNPKQHLRCACAFSSYYGFELVDWQHPHELVRYRVYHHERFRDDEHASAALDRLHTALLALLRAIEHEDVLVLAFWMRRPEELYGNGENGGLWRADESHARRPRGMIVVRVEDGQHYARLAFEVAIVPPSLSRRTLDSDDHASLLHDLPIQEPPLRQFEFRLCTKAIQVPREARSLWVVRTEHSTWRSVVVRSWSWCGACVWRSIKIARCICTAIHGRQSSSICSSSRSPRCWSTFTPADI